MAATVLAAASGHLVVPPDPASGLLRHAAAGPDSERPAALLTPREREVLALVAHGRTNREIGLALAMSLGTVKAHLEHILAKLGASHRTDAAVRAIRLGLLDADAAAEAGRDVRPAASPDAPPA
jgi:DNA-binding NarL/FixJ family response regulator